MAGPQIQEAYEPLENRELLDRIQMMRIPTVNQNHIAFETGIPGITSGKELVDWYLGFFGALSTLGTLGAGFTLSVVVQGSNAPSPAGFSPAIVNTWAAVSSVLFVLTVLVCQGCVQLFKFERGSIVEGIDNDDHVIKHTLSGLSLLLQVQVLGAFLFLELVLTAHSPVVGGIGIAITSLLALIALCLWALQATGRRPVTHHVATRNASSSRLRERQM
ncbi:hypothetical protein LTR37_020407 [Vermiconidia calcicola]|uniref:Uncharacterized protein n=1 Tax=Vermiconidia calcicola TaxID=1690605 RepID=A0ACC3MB98_9PEZI|nr:hypothetical protein LTR37_020407 [Vermiconidia calcicola]